MNMHCIRRGTGKPLLLVHGIGGSWRSWELVIDSLANAGREVLAVDLPGHGATPPLAGEVSIRTLADALTDFLKARNLLGIDAVGSSMGARLVLELVRRGGVLGTVVSLDPGGFWQGLEVPAFYYSVAASVRIVRLLQPHLPAIAHSSIGRTLLLAQFSAKPWRLPPRLVQKELQTIATSPSFDELLYNLAYGEEQQGAPQGSIQAPLVIGWGRQDRVCFTQQAQRALTKFPDAQLYWFTDCGHFPQWDSPGETVRLILAVTDGEDPSSLRSATGPESTAQRKRSTIFAIGLALVVGAIWLIRRKKH